MDQLTWLQQSLQKPRLSAVARALADVFPRDGVPLVTIGESSTPQGTYNSAAPLAGLHNQHLEYPGYVLRCRDHVNGGNYVGYGWGRVHTDHIGVLGGQVTVVNDGFFVGSGGPWAGGSGPAMYKTWHAGDWSGDAPSYDTNNFASLVPVKQALLTDPDAPPLLIGTGDTMLLTDLSITFEEPIARGFTSVQWLTEGEVSRNK